MIIPLFISVNFQESSGESYSDSEVIVDQLFAENFNHNLFVYLGFGHIANIRTAICFVSMASQITISITNIDSEINIDE